MARPANPQPGHRVPELREVGCPTRPRHDWHPAGLLKALEQREDVPSLLERRVRPKKLILLTTADDGADPNQPDPTVVANGEALILEVEHQHVLEFEPILSEIDCAALLVAPSMCLPAAVRAGPRRRPRSQRTSARRGVPGWQRGGGLCPRCTSGPWPSWPPGRSSAESRSRDTCKSWVSRHPFWPFGSPRTSPIPRRTTPAGDGPAAPLGAPSPGSRRTYLVAEGAEGRT